MSKKLTTAEFDQAIQSDKPVLVDFYADWCGPCKMLAPTIDEIAEEYADKVDVYKLNVDESAEIATRYEVMSIPTLIVFKAGEAINRNVGFLPKDQVVKMFE